MIDCAKSLLLALKLLLIASLVASESNPKLPSIWTAIGGRSTYHLIFQLSTSASAEQLTIEEWASFDKKLFRLDLISKKSRLTYLTNGVTGEVLRYKPFTCELLTSDAKDFGVISDLFRGYALGGENGKAGSVLAYGIGPLWIWAEKSASNVNYTAADRANKLSLYQYDSYETTFTEPKVYFNLKFYFRVKGTKFVDAIEWRDTKTSTIANEKPEAMAKLTLLDLEPLDVSVFDIPLGYGCARGESFDHSIDVSPRYEIFHQGSPNQAIIEVLTSRPKDKALQSWDSHKYTIRMLRGSLVANGNQTHTYYVVQTQSRNSETSRLERVKHIWSALESSSDSATVYEINPETNECLPTFRSFRDHVKLNFPGIVGDNSKSTLSLSTDFITKLFSDRDGYHMLIDKQTSGAKLEAGLEVIASSYRDSYYEKRLKSLQLDGSTVVGPVSIVKKITSYAPFLNNFSVDQDLQRAASTYHMAVTLYFYSDDMSKILYKTVIDLVQSVDVDVKYLHQELDLSSCFPLDQQEDIVIRYPLDMQDLSKRLHTIQDLVEELFIMNLFTTTPLRPTQVTNVQLNFDTFFMYVQLTLIDLPLTHLFNLKHDKQLAKGSESTALVEKVSSNLEKCSASCDYYSCYRFSYDLTQLVCRLEVKKNGALVEDCSLCMLFESTDEVKNDSLWSKVSAENGRTHLRPHSVLSLLNEMIEYEQSNTTKAAPSVIVQDYSYTPIPLRLRIEDILLPDKQLNDPEFIELRPISVQSDMESMNEYVKEELKHSDDSKFSIIHNENVERKFKLQYTILLESREFYDNIADGKLIEGLGSYEDCEKSCEDTDCRSFSYCQFKDACHVTYLHDVESIKSSSTGDTRCTIFTLDYLSKFEPFGSVLTAPIVAKAELTNVPQQPIQCAATCLEESSFSCQGFYHCKVDSSSYNCYLIDKHIEETTDEERPKFNGQTYVMETSLQTKIRDCKFFSRSYLAQFDKYFDKALEFSGDKLESSSRVILNQGAELCAQRCIETSCLAFDVCLQSDNQLQVCHLVTDGIRKSHLVSRRKCTTFVLSDKSQYNIINAKLFNERPNKKAPIDANNNSSVVVIDSIGEKVSSNDLTAKLMDLYKAKEHNNKIIGGSHWLSKCLSLLFGLIIGIGFASIWNKRDDIYIYATSRYSEWQRR